MELCVRRLGAARRIDRRSTVNYVMSSGLGWMAICGGPVQKVRTVWEFELGMFSLKLIYPVSVSLGGRLESYCWRS